MEIRLLGPDDCDAYDVLRLRALREHPEAFLMTPEEHAAAPVDVRRQWLTSPPDGGHGALGAFEDGALVGTVGWMRQSRPKVHHTVEVFAMYVAPEFGGRGIGTALIDRVVERARALDGVERVTICVMETQAAARRVYERAGFVTWGVEPAAVALGDRRLDEHHMVLALR